MARLFDGIRKVRTGDRTRREPTPQHGYNILDMVSLVVADSQIVKRVDANDPTLGVRLIMTCWNGS
jgi:hypothetical protein